MTMAPPEAQLLLLDSQDYSSALLRDELLRRGFPRVAHGDPAGDLRAALAGGEPDVVIVNYHFDSERSLDACAEVKRLAPAVPVVAIASAGPALKHVSAWARRTRHIDVVIEKPLSDERFFVVVGDLASARQAVRRQQAHLARLTNLVPEPALDALRQDRPGEAELFEAAVLFTDVRRSTQLIATLRPEDYFAALNRALSAQSRVLESGRGSVVKYTGDGVLAIFRGLGSTRLALRAGLELTNHEAQEILPFGIGLAHGLVLGGFVGDSHQSGRRAQYDVIGSTVHLAARLCTLAHPGELVTTRRLQLAARAETPEARPVGPVALRGFAESVDCVAFRAAPSPTPSLP